MMVITMDKRLISSRQIELQFDNRKATALTEKLLLSRGLNPDHEPILGRIVHAYYLLQVQSAKAASIGIGRALPTDARFTD